MVLVEADGRLIGGGEAGRISTKLSGISPTLSPSRTSHHPSFSVFLLTISTISPTLMVSSSGLSASYSNVTLAFSTDFEEDD